MFKYNKLTKKKGCNSNCIISRLVGNSERLIDSLFMGLALPPPPGKKQLYAYAFYKVQIEPKKVPKRCFFTKSRMAIHLHWNN